MTCAKVTVQCTIVGGNGITFVAINACNNPQPVCPRAPGEGYEKCKSICDQQGHAEIQALRLAGKSARDGRAIIRGHTHACKECQEALYAAGILWIGVRK